MAIETSPKAAPAHPARGGADARASKAKGSPDAPGADAGALAFMAILSAVGDPPAESLPSEAGADTRTEVALDALPLAAVDPALLPSNPPLAEAPLAGSTVAATAAPGLGARAAGARADAAGAADAALGGATEPRTKSWRGLAQPKPAPGAALQEVPMAQGTAAQERPQHDFKLFAAMQAQGRVHAVPEPEVALASVGLWAEKPSSERALWAKQTSEAAYPGAAGDAGAVEFSSGAPLEVAPVLETQAAEQVKYWISQDVQNAELQLDGLGENPVEVSIRMQGNEAHVAFRTDELQTHSLLEGAGAQLKDMLAREGVVLAGVSVGNSGTRDGQGGERKPRQGVKIAQVVPAPSAAVDAPRRSVGAAGRAVDLFV